MTQCKGRLPEHVSMQIDLLGVYPPPIGGVSVHIKRLQQELHSLGVQCLVYDLGAEQHKYSRVIPVSHARNWLLSRLVSSPSKSIVHYHAGNWKYLAILSMILRLRSEKLVCTLHSLRDEWETSSFVTKACIRVALKLVDHFIVVAPHISDKLGSWGVDHRKVSVIPAFIPPRPTQSDYDRIPNHIWEFIEKHSPIITANAFKISFHKDVDLYGIDMCIKLCADLQHDFPNLGFVFCLPDIGDHQYFDKMKRELSTRQLDDNFLFVNETIEYYPILSRSDLFVRPTNTDGDAVSIREALALGIATVCSDVVARPAGALRFRSRDSRDLREKAHWVLSEEAGVKKIQGLLEVDSVLSSSVHDVYNIYCRLLGIKVPKFTGIDV